MFATLPPVPRVMLAATVPKPVISPVVVGPEPPSVTPELSVNAPPCREIMPEATVSAPLTVSAPDAPTASVEAAPPKVKAAEVAAAVLLNCNIPVVAML